MVSIGIVTALEFEARIPAKKGCFTVVRCAPAGRDAESVVRRLAESDHDLIVSWGTAGALSPELKAGDIYLPEEVITRGGIRISTDPGWRARFLESVEDSCLVRSGALVDSSHVVGEPHSKRVLRVSTGANAVDMESGPVGEACERLGVPFLVIRAIIDELEDHLPQHIATGLGTDGTLRPKAVLGGFILRPRDWLTLVRLVRRYKQARASLAIAAGVLRRCNRG